MAGLRASGIGEADLEMTKTVLASTSAPHVGSSAREAHAIAAVLGALQGLVLYALSQNAVNFQNAGSPFSPGWFAATAFGTAWLPAFLLFWSGTRFALVFATGWALPPALCAFLVMSTYAGEDASGVPVAGLFILAIGWCFLLPLAHAVLTAEQHRWRFETLIDDTIALLFVLAAAGTTTAVVWLLLMTWTVACTALGLAFVAQLFGGPVLAAISGSAFAFGIRIGVEYFPRLQALASLAVRLARLLMTPFLLMLWTVVLAAMAMWFGLNNAGKVDGDTLLAFASVGVVLLALARGDTGFPEASRWYRMLEVTAAFGLLIVSVTALTRLAIRIEDRGLTPLRFVGLLIAAWLALHMVAQVGALALRSGARLRWTQINAASIAVAAVLCILVNTPLLDPLRISAWQQYHRLSSGAVNAGQFDFRLLMRKLGPAGRAYADRLYGLDEHPEIDAIRRAIDAVRYDDGRTR